jgi:predicted urease superfamily metal-dependent hydrolase
MITMKRSTVGPMTALMVLLAVGTVYAQHRAEHGGTGAKTADAVEVFCDHMGTGQLCAGSNATAKLFNLSGAKKDRYVEAINNYNKAVEAAQKQFLMDAKVKVGLEPAQLAVAEMWFAAGLNPEINKIIGVKETK